MWLTNGCSLVGHLVGHVEEGKVVLLGDEVGNLGPLLLGGVHTGGVVGAPWNQAGTAGLGGD